MHITIPIIVFTFIIFSNLLQALNILKSSPFITNLNNLILSYTLTPNKKTKQDTRIFEIMPASKLETSIPVKFEFTIFSLEVKITVRANC